MPDKLKEYVRHSIDELLASLPAEERLKGLSAKEVVRALPPETLQELARLLKTNGHSAEPGAPEPGAPADGGRDPGS